jgi:hypothetical protein
MAEFEREGLTKSTNDVLLADDWNRLVDELAHLGARADVADGNAARLEAANTRAQVDGETQLGDLDTRMTGLIDSLRADLRAEVRAEVAALGERHDAELRGLREDHDAELLRLSELTASRSRLELLRDAVGLPGIPNDPLGRLAAGGVNISDPVRVDLGDDKFSQITVEPQAIRFALVEVTVTGHSNKTLSYRAATTIFTAGEGAARRTISVAMQLGHNSCAGVRMQAFVPVVEGRFSYHHHDKLAASSGVALALIGYVD